MENERLLELTKSEASKIIAAQLDLADILRNSNVDEIEPEIAIMVKMAIANGAMLDALMRIRHNLIEEVESNRKVRPWIMVAFVATSIASFLIGRV